MPQKKSGKNLKSYRSRVKGNKSEKTNRKLDFLLLLVSVIVVAFVGSFLLKYSLGQTTAQPAEPIFLRFQVLNGCGDSGAAGKMSQYISERCKLDYAIDVIDEGNFESFDQEKTLLIVRDAKREVAENLARLIGLDLSQIVSRPFEDNYLDIQFTLLVGKDYKSFLTADNKSK